MPEIWLNVTVPVHDEERVLEANVRRVAAFLESRYGEGYELVIADNASRDRTLERAEELAVGQSRVRVVHLEEQGRGGALKRAWGTSPARVLSYLDCDLSTAPEALPGLVEPVAEGLCDVAAGSRLLPESRTTRSSKREVLSRGYNWLVRGWLGAGFSDAQCGFKALSREAAAQLLPLVEDDHWFFDTELLLLAQARGLRLLEVPVRWVEEPASHVRIVRTAIAQLQGLWRMRRQLAGRLGTRTRV
jgi:glycosyltransferase involved in cell wall biosynthesis